MLTGTFVVMHIATVAIDAYLPFSIVSLAVPLVASYRPIWTGLGIVAAELLLALAFTNHYRNTKLPYAVLATGALRELRDVGGGDPAWHRNGDGSQHAVDARDHARSPSARLRADDLARAPADARARWTWAAARGRLRSLAIARLAIVAALGSGPLRFQPKAVERCQLPATP